MVLKNLSLNQPGTKTATAPRIRQSAEDVIRIDAEDPLNATDTLLFRSCLMRISYLAQDRPDISEAVKSLAQRMRDPKPSDLTALKHLARYLKGKPTTSIIYPSQALTGRIMVHVDTDFAGCLRSRKSTTGHVARLGHHVIHHGSNLQSTISLSSGEAETYGILKGTAIGLGIQSLLKDWNVKCSVSVYFDSSAARSISSRRGIGRVRHINTRYLWIQEKLADKSFTLHVVKGTDNPADMMTKPFSGKQIQEVFASLNIHFTPSSDIQPLQSSSPSSLPPSSHYPSSASTPSYSTSSRSAKSNSATSNLILQDSKPPNSLSSALLTPTKNTQYANPQSRPPISTSLCSTSYKHGIQFRLNAFKR